MEGMKFFGWVVVSKCGISHSGILYTNKKEADEHCDEWNRDERLGDYRPYGSVELFRKDERQP